MGLDRSVLRWKNPSCHAGCTLKITDSWDIIYQCCFTPTVENVWHNRWGFHIEFLFSFWMLTPGSFLLGLVELLKIHMNSTSIKWSWRLSGRHQALKLNHNTIIAILWWETVCEEIFFSFKLLILHCFCDSIRQDVVVPQKKKKKDVTSWRMMTRILHTNNSTESKDTINIFRGHENVQHSRNDPHSFL